MVKTNNNIELVSQTGDVAVSAVSALVGFAIGGPIGAVIGGVTSPGIKLAHQVAEKWYERRKSRVTRILENGCAKSGKSNEIIMEELLENPEWADAMISMIQHLVDTDPELDELYSNIVAAIISSEDESERKRLNILSKAISGLDKVQIQILDSMYDAGGTMSASDISSKVLVPEMELRNCVRDLELRGMIIDNGSEPTVWSIRELGIGIAQSIKIWEGKQ